MAGVKTILLVAGVVANLVRAAPIVDVTVTNTVVKTTWTTRNCMATVWIPAGQSPVASSSPKGQSKSFGTTSAYTPAPAPTTTSVYVPPPPAPTTSVYVAPTTTSSPEPPPQPTTTAYTPPVPATPETTAYTPPAPVTTEAPVYTPEPTTVYTPPPVETPAAAPSTASPAAPASTYNSQPGQFVSASASNTCEGAGEACEGDVTHYDGGLGACGWNVDTESELSVALPVGLMGAQSNGNPYCGRTLTIKNPVSGTTVQAKVGDKCMGCQGRAIDLTNKLFQAVTDGTGDGRESGYQWWFN